MWVVAPRHAGKVENSTGTPGTPGALEILQDPWDPLGLPELLGFLGPSGTPGAPEDPQRPFQPLGLYRTPITPWDPKSLSKTTGIPRDCDREKH